MSTATPRDIEEYVTLAGRSPFSEWFNALKDRKTRAKIRVRLDRLSLGNFGDYRALSGHLRELRIDVGPGYRIYVAEVDNRVILLLIGGTKKAQQKDIDKAREYWQDYRAREL
ncbi:type II toxin-antitoxin system RelE/ParE family toxin [Synechococcus sp. PCC 7336]|uniref:type II toxin-antitoxin system RelE/ParE family toxin n=1 Tax=Synechococcus sp. PCC 7336 TaxID=195250 RepID=UPI000477FFD3|nr:type II toxin-antitoxin system RelE/ParE family toxin [Synechococcus sp. PCC 7336]